MESKIQRYAFKEEAKIGFEIVDLAETYARHRAQMTVPHRTDFYHVLLIRGGAARHFVDFQTVELPSAPSLLFIDKDAVHAFDDVERIEGHGIVFLESFFCAAESDARFLRETVCFNSFRTISKLDAASDIEPLKQWFAGMRDAARRPPEAHRAAFLRNSLHNFLILAERLLRDRPDFKALPNGPDMKLVVAFRQLLNAHFRAERAIGFYAAALRVSENRLYRAAQNVLGQTPKQLIGERLALEAKRLLAHSERPVKAIGYELGFGEPTNFIQFFKKMAGAPPAAWRDGQRRFSGIKF